MSKTQTMAIVAISTTVLRTKLYVQSLSTRPGDQKQVAEFTSNPALACDFETTNKAQQTIPLIVNHSEKVFEVVKLQLETTIRKNSLSELK